MMQYFFIEQNACMQRSKTNQKTGAGMCQDQVMQEVKVDVGVEVFLEAGDFHHHPGWTRGCWILMLNSRHVKTFVEVRV